MAVGAEGFVEHAGFRPASSRLWILAALVALMSSHPTHAALFAPGCTMGVGDAAQLQADVATANGNNQADTITLTAGCTYTLTATLTIQTDTNILAIEGMGATISGGGTLEVFVIDTGTNLTLNSVTVSGGNAVNGGGALNNGTL